MKGGNSRSDYQSQLKVARIALTICVVGIFLGMLFGLFGSFMPGAANVQLVFNLIYGLSTLIHIIFMIQMVRVLGEILDSERIQRIAKLTFGLVLTLIVAIVLMIFLPSLLVRQGMFGLYMVTIVNMILQAFMAVVFYRYYKMFAIAFNELVALKKDRTNNIQSATNQEDLV